MKQLPYHSVRTSKIHGRGVFARRPIRKGTKIIEYTGPIISQKKADKIGAADIDGHSHTMLFQIDKKRVINGIEGGDARYINHSCDPNCEAVQYGDRIFIEALRSIKKGEELVYDYYLQVPGKITKKVKQRYACFCGSAKCRGTQIAPEILEKVEAKEKAKAKAEAKKKAEVKAKEKAKALKKLKEKEKKEALKAQKKEKKAREKAAKEKEKERRKLEKKKKKKAEKSVMGSLKT